MKDTQGIFFKDFNNSYVPHILKELYIDKIYDQFFAGKKDLTILDLGANVGLFSFYVYPFAKTIYAVEPSFEHFDTLNQMLMFNHMTDKVIPIQKAIALNDGKAEFFLNTNTTAYSLSENMRSNGCGSEEVETIKLDTLFTQYEIDHVDFMKLDIEGTECEIVGSDTFEKVADKVENIVVEYHTWSGVNPSLLATALKDYGFTVYSIPTDATIIAGVREND
jgi:FkbM family methyltransferase